MGYSQLGILRCASDLVPVRSIALPMTAAMVRIALMVGPTPGGYCVATASLGEHCAPLWSGRALLSSSWSHSQVVAFLEGYGVIDLVPVRSIAPTDGGSHGAHRAHGRSHSWRIVRCDLIPRYEHCAPLWSGRALLSSRWSHSQVVAFLEGYGGIDLVPVRSLALPMAAAMVRIALMVGLTPGG